MRVMAHTGAQRTERAGHWRERAQRSVGTPPIDRSTLAGWQTAQTEKEMPSRANRKTLAGWQPRSMGSNRAA